MATNVIAEGWGRLKARIEGYEFFVNLLSPMILLGVNFVHLFCGFLPRVPLGWISVIVVDVYLFLLMLLTALKLPKRIPERQVALVTVPALLLIRYHLSGTQRENPFISLRNATEQDRTRSENVNDFFKMVPTSPLVLRRIEFTQIRNC
jgi:hypothetical protein